MSKWKIAVIDDDQRNYGMIEQTLIFEYELMNICGEDLLHQVLSFKPDLVLLRAEDSITDAYDLCEKLKSHLATKRIPILMMSRRKVDYEKALKVGVSDLISLYDPMDFIILRINAHLIAGNQAKSCQSYMKDMKTENANITAALLKFMGKLIEYKDYHNDDHVFRVGKYVYMMAIEMNFSEEDAVRLMKASYLHDIGKLILKDDLLLKKGSLTYGEWQEMTEHTSVIETMIAGNIDFVKMIKNIATQHHEKYNGLGYPNQLAGTAISLEARIVSLCEVFDALTHQRNHREAWAYNEVIDFIRAESGESFDPEIVEVFMSNIDKFIDIKQNKW